MLLLSLTLVFFSTSISVKVFAASTDKNNYTFEEKANLKDVNLVNNKKIINTSSNSSKVEIKITIGNNVIVLNISGLLKSADWNDYDCCDNLTITFYSIDDTSSIDVLKGGNSVISGPHTLTKDERQNKSAIVSVSGVSKGEILDVVAYDNNQTEIDKINVEVE